MDKNKNAQSRYHSVFSSVIVAALVLLAVVFLMQDRSPQGLKPIQLATGEWQPFTGRSLPEHGITTAVVTRILNSMGYSPQFQFMPWSIAESSAARGELVDGLRGTFPFIKPDDQCNEDSKRDRQFYYSEPLMSVPQSVFYDQQWHAQADALTTMAQIRQHRLLAITGYQYPEKVSCLVRDMREAGKVDEVPSTEAALVALSQGPTPYLLIESTEVVRQLVMQDYPHLQSRIKTTAIKLEDLQLRLLLSKRIGENLTLRRRFDRELEALRSDEQSFQRFLNDTRFQIELNNSAWLVPAHGQSRIVAYTNPHMERSVTLPLGSRAKVMQWPAAFFLNMPADEANPNGLVKIRPLNGPLASRKPSLYVSADSIRLSVPTHNPREAAYGDQ